MKIIKKFLRGIFYFGVGVKAAFSDFCEWYTTNKALPRFMRNKISLVVMILAVVAGGWGLVAAFTGGSGQRKPVSALPEASRGSSVSESERQSSAPFEPSSSEASSSEASSSAASSDEASSSEVSSSAASSDGSSSAASSSKPAVDAIASATRFAPVTADQLAEILKERVKAYYEHPVFIPPAAGDIAGWQKVNPDVRAWITIPSTNISWPVVIGPYTDYYTHRGYYKEASRNGVIWFDTDVKFDAAGEITSRNAVIYGHNWTNCWRPTRVGNSGDVMFAQLAAYDNADFAAANPYIRIATPGGDHVYQVFSVFYTDLSFVYVYTDGATVSSIIQTAKAKDIHKLNVPVGANDKIITLSTCTRVLGAGDNQRFVVMAKKIS